MAVPLARGRDSAMMNKPAMTRIRPNNVARDILASPDLFKTASVGHQHSCPVCGLFQRR